MYKIIIDTQEELNNTKDLCSLIHDRLSEKSAKEDPKLDRLCSTLQIAMDRLDKSYWDLDESFHIAEDFGLTE